MTSDGFSKNGLGQFLWIEFLFPLGSIYTMGYPLRFIFGIKLIWLLILFILHWIWIINIYHFLLLREDSPFSGNITFSSKYFHIHYSKKALLFKNFYLFIFGACVCVILCSLDQRSNLCSLQWKHSLKTTGPLGKSPKRLFLRK